MRTGALLAKRCNRRWRSACSDCSFHIAAPSHFGAKKDRNYPYRQLRSSRPCCIFVFLVKSCGLVEADCFPALLSIPPSMLRPEIHFHFIPFQRLCKLALGARGYRSNIERQFRDNCEEVHLSPLACFQTTPIYKVRRMPYFLTL